MIKRRSTTLNRIL